MQMILLSLILHLDSNINIRIDLEKHYVNYLIKLHALESIIISFYLMSQLTKQHNITYEQFIPQRHLKRKVLFSVHVSI